MTTFTEAKAQFDAGPGNSRVLPVSLVPVDGKLMTYVNIRNTQGKPLEEYYKWQFIYALLYSGLYTKDYIGVEVRLALLHKSTGSSIVPLHPAFS